jgi:hypothetical protein
MHYPAIKTSARFHPRPASQAKTRHPGYFFGAFETFAAALTAGFLAGFSPASAIAFGLAADLAAVFGFFGAMPVSAVLGLVAVLVAVVRATLPLVSASALDLAFGLLTLSSPAGVAFDFVLTGFFAAFFVGFAATVSASFASWGGMTRASSCSSKWRAFSQYSVDRPSGRPSASHRWYACKRSFSSKDLLCIPLTISRIRAFMLQERRTACERVEGALSALVELGIHLGTTRGQILPRYKNVFFPVLGCLADKFEVSR